MHSPFEGLEIPKCKAGLFWSTEAFWPDVFHDTSYTTNNSQD